MDLVLLVIAADEGIMPQTREHIDILSELGIRNGIIVLNKCDLVDAEWLEFAEQEIREELDEMDGCCFADAPLLRVSAVTGEGIERLIETITRTAMQIAGENGTAFGTRGFRLFVDRVFSKDGFGTVVTGTVMDGSLKRAMSWNFIRAGKSAVCGTCRYMKKKPIFAEQGNGRRAIFPV